MDISIFGIGYVGCVSLGCLAKNGHRVIGVDVNMTKIDFINHGKSPIRENEIDRIIYEQYHLGKISATNDGISAVKATDLSFICVGTPSTTNGHLECEAVFKVAEEIGKGIKEKETFHVVGIRSTVIPGTCEKVEDMIEKVSGKNKSENFAVISNPEFLREGSSVKDFNSPSYTLIGASEGRAIEFMKEIYKEIESPFIVTDIKIAELIKYVNNSFHGLKITFANEIGNICKKLGIDSHKLMDIFCLDKKLNLSSYYLKPGFAFGGSCLPKDLKALKTIAHDFYLECPVLENIEASNELQKKIVLQQILQFKKQRVGFLGISFKSGTDDLRKSPIIDIIERLLGKGFEIKIYDIRVQLSNLIGANKEYILNKIPFVSKFIVNTFDELLENSDVIVAVNKEDEFIHLLDRVPNKKIIYDLVNIDFNNRENHKNYSGINW